MTDKPGSTAPRDRVSLRDLALDKLGPLCNALGLSSQKTKQAIDLFDLMSAPWNQWAAGETPPWRNDISDDGTPFEFSVAFDGARPALRMLVESQDGDPTPTSSWHAGLALAERLAHAGFADLSLLKEVQDLFAPGPQPARFSLWHASVLRESGSPLLKAYLNPQVLGAASAPLLVERALDRLDLGAAWDFLAPRVQDPRSGNELRYFAVDLDRPQEARVKIYVGRSDSASAIEELASGSNNLRAGDVRSWLGKLTGREGPYDARPVLCCFSFTRGALRPEVTLHVPVRSYVRHDGDAARRISDLLSADDSRTLERSLAAMARRPLSVARGLLTYASLRREANGLRTTVYLAPEVYSIASRRPSILPPASVASQPEARTPESGSRPTPRLVGSATLGDVEDAIQRHRRLLSQHPFLRRLETSGSVQEIRRMVPRLGFFVMAFQDVLRLAREGCTEPGIREIARTHELEDKGHDRWYLSDLKRLGVALDVEWLFSDEHELTRNVGYTLVSTVMTAKDDRTRLSVGLSLEAIGAEFFGRVIGFLERIGESDGLLYFARRHQEIESQHEMFEDAAQQNLRAIPVSAEALTESLSAVERTFEAMTRLANDLEICFDSAQPSPVASPARATAA